MGIIYEKILGIPGAVGAQPYFQEGCPDSHLTLKHHQQAQARLSTEAGRFGLPSTEARRMPVSIGSRVGTLPEVLADLTGPLGNKLRRGLPESSVIAQLEDSLLEIRDIWGVSQEAMAGIVPEPWLEWGLGAEGGWPQDPQRPTCWLHTTPEPRTRAKSNRSWASW